MMSNRSKGSFWGKGAANDDVKIDFSPLCPGSPPFVDFVERERDVSTGGGTSLGNFYELMIFFVQRKHQLGWRNWKIGELGTHWKFENSEPTAVIKIARCRKQQMFNAA